MNEVNLTEREISLIATALCLMDNQVRDGEVINDMDVMHEEIMVIGSKLFGYPPPPQALLDEIERKRAELTTRRLMREMGMSEAQVENPKREV